MELWSLIQNQPLLKTIYLKPPITSYKRGKFPKDTLKIKNLNERLSCELEATAKTTLGVRASLSLTYSLIIATHSYDIYLLLWWNRDRTIWFNTQPISLTGLCCKQTHKMRSLVTTHIWNVYLYDNEHNLETIKIKSSQKSLRSQYSLLFAQKTF